jgi:hypothetical protein
MIFLIKIPIMEHSEVSFIKKSKKALNWQIAVY